MDVDLKLNFGRLGGVHLEGVRKAQALRIKLGRMDVPRVGGVIPKVWDAC